MLTFFNICCVSNRSRSRPRICNSDNTRIKEFIVDVHSNPFVCLHIRRRKHSCQFCENLFTVCQIEAAHLPRAC